MARPEPRPDPVRVGYLTSQYPATSHTFIRREVAALRALGLSVETFSVRSPGDDELVDGETRLEADSTYILLSQSLSRFAAAHLSELARAPMRYLRTFVLAMRHRAPGVRAAILAIAHFGEAILLAATLRERRIDHLHNHFANSGATVGLLASEMAAIPWSFTIHGISEFDYPAGNTLAAKIERASFVACVSYFGRAQAARFTSPAQWSKLRIVRCGLALDRLPDPSSNAVGRVRLIAVGRLSPEKGIAGLLAVLASYSATRNFHLVIVGDGPLRDDLEAEAVRLGLMDQVNFKGRLGEEATLAEVARSDILVLPSFMEGLPVVLMEAAALGKAVIASRVAGIPELVGEDESGLLFAPSDWGELSVKLGRLIDDAVLRQALGAAGRQRISPDFDVRTSATILMDLFRQSDRSESTLPEPLSGQARDTSGFSKEHRPESEAAPRA